MKQFGRSNWGPIAEYFRGAPDSHASLAQPLGPGPSAARAGRTARQCSDRWRRIGDIPGLVAAVPEHLGGALSWGTAESAGGAGHGARAEGGPAANGTPEAAAGAEGPPRRKGGRHRPVVKHPWAPEVSRLRVASAARPLRGAAAGRGGAAAQEDALLEQLIQQNGAKDWSEIAKFLPLRCGKQVCAPPRGWGSRRRALTASARRSARCQCRERWFNHLCPGVKKGEWTTEEDALIFEHHKACRLGACRTRLCARLP